MGHLLEPKGFCSEEKKINTRVNGGMSPPATFKRNNLPLSNNLFQNNAQEINKNIQHKTREMSQCLISNKKYQACKEGRKKNDQN